VVAVPRAGHGLRQLAAAAAAAAAVVVVVVQVEP
jgi:hypothetical protein